MWMLTVTLCLATGPDAECTRMVRYVETQAECREVGRAHVEYLKQSTAPRVRVIFSSASCNRGLDM